MQKSKIFIMILCLVAILAISASFASDDINNIPTNTSDVLSIDNAEIQSSADDMESQAEENQISAAGGGTDDVCDMESQSQEDKIKSDSNNTESKNNEKLGAVNDGSEDVLGDEGNFQELKTEIINLFKVSSSKYLTLDKDYVYTDARFFQEVSMPNGYVFTVDGNNHTVDFKNKESPFTFFYSRTTTTSTVSTYRFKNIHFTNIFTKVFIVQVRSSSGNGPTVNFEIINCTFTNDNLDLGSGNITSMITVSSSLYNNFNLKVEGCDFYNLSGRAGRVLSVNSGKVDVEISDCSFTNISTTANSAIEGVITSVSGFNSLNIINSNFENIDVENPAGDGDGGIIHATFVSPQKTFNLINSTFINCKSNANGGVLYFHRSHSAAISGSIELVVNIDNSTFINNYGGNNGGVMYFGWNTFGGTSNFYFNYNINIKNGCTFINNSAKNNGGVIGHTQQSASSTANMIINIQKDCSFINNHAGNEGGVLFLSGSKLSDTIRISDNCYFENNSAGGGRGGVISLGINGDVEITNASFVNNSAASPTNYNDNYGGGAIFIRGLQGTDSYLKIYNSTFSGNYLDGPALAGGAINTYLRTSTVIQNTVFSDNHISTSTGSAIHFNGKGINNFDNVTFENNVAHSEYRPYAAQGGTVSLNSNSNSNYFNGCKFINNTVDAVNGRGGAVYLINGGSGSIDFKNTEFKDNSATNGGAVYVGYGWYSPWFIDSNFTNNSADEYGGAIYLYETDILVRNSMFNENSAVSGGALYSQESRITVDNSSFEKNSAVRSGGAIYLHEFGAYAEITNSDFTNNSAENIYGGAIFAGIGSDTTIDQSTFTYNSAYQGSAINYQAETGVESFHSISNSRFTDNNANSTQLILTADAAKKSLEVIYFGGNNYIDAIKSYNNVEFSNVTYHSYYGDIITTANGDDVGHTYIVPYQQIHLEFLDVNNNTLYEKYVWTDENGRNITDIPDDSDIRYIRASRAGDSYYKSFVAGTAYGIGEFDLLQTQISATDEGETLFLLRNYTYSLDLDSITEGIEITKAITIDGQGHTIDALYKSRVFKILANNVKFINITFVNSTNWSGSFIYGISVDNIEIDNCRFENTNGLHEISDSQSEELDPDDDIIFNGTSETYDGGAVYIIGENTLTNNSEFINLLAMHGGAMYLEGINHTIANSYFNHTRAALAGGAIFASYQDIKIINSVFENCFADDEVFDEMNIDWFIINRAPKDAGGLEPGSPISHDTQSFKGNNLLSGGYDPIFPGEEISEDDVPVIARGGGAVYFDGESLIIYNSSFTNCTTNSFGGAVYTSGSYSRIYYSNFTLSSAISGGAIFFDVTAYDSIVEHSIFSNNTAEANGGAISWYAKSGTLSNSQFINNTQRRGSPSFYDGGGAVYWLGNKGSIENVTFTNNRVSFPIDNWDYFSDNPYISTYDELREQDRTEAFLGPRNKGGALLIRGNYMTITDSLFKENYAQSGGAIAVEIFDFVQEIDNLPGDGGGTPITPSPIHNLGDKLGEDEVMPDPLPDIMYSSYIVVVENTKFIDNFAQYGGAVSVQYINEISSGPQESNTGEDELNTEMTTPDYYNKYKDEWNYFVNCEFYNNTAYLAGALYLDANHCNVGGCIFEDNAAFIGGAIFNGGMASREIEVIKPYWDELYGDYVYYPEREIVDFFLTGNFNYISGTTFKHNYALYAGAVYWLGDDGAIGYNSRFIENGYKDTFERYSEDVYECYGIILNPYEYYYINWHIETDGETGTSQPVGFEIPRIPPVAYEGYGGAVVWYGGNGNIENTEFIQNYALNGGAIFAMDILGFSDSLNWQTFITIDEVRFENNSAGSGGAISVYNGNGAIRYSQFINNDATLNVEPGYRFSNIFEHENDGGAIFWNGLDVTVYSSDFINNSAINGGAISIRADYEGNGENSFIDNCTFENNSAVNGSAIYNEADNVQISGTFINNTATQYGGAIYNSGNNVGISYSTFIYNKADTGSAIYDVSNGMEIEYSSFEQNKAGALSLIVYSAEVTGNDARIEVVFKGNDNLMNALYVMNMPVLNHVEYWGAQGMMTDWDYNPTISYPEAGMNITFEFINSEYSSIHYTQMATTNWNGNAVATVSGMRGGRYYVLISHSDDSYYTEISTFLMINIGKVESPIQIEIEDIYYRQNETTNITLNRDTTGNVTVQIDGKNYTNVNLTGNDGQIMLENISSLEAGLHNITVIYHGDAQYASSSKTEKFIVMQIPSTVNITTDGGVYKESIPVNITVENDAKGKVIVTIQDEFGYTILINDTNELQAIVNGLNVGEYNITAYYTGDNNYMPSNNQTTFTVNPVVLNPTVKAANVTVGQNTTFTITLPDDFVGNVNITVDGITKTYAVEGSTQITFVQLEAGNKSAEVRFYGNRNYIDATVYPVNFTVTEIEVTPVYTISIDIPDTTYLMNTTATVNISGNMYGNAVIFIDGRNFTAVIENGTGSVDINGLAAGVKTAVVNFTSADNKINLTASTKFAIDKAQSYVNISFDGETVKVNITDGATGTVDVYINGVKEVFEYNGTVITCENKLIIGNNTVVAVYEGNQNYTESQNDNNMDIPKKYSLVNVTADPIAYGDDALIVVRVGEEQTGHVTITVINENYTAEIRDHGALFNIPGLNAGNYTVTVKYSGDGNHDVQSNNTTLMVNKADLNATVIGQNVTVAENTSFVISNVADSFKGSVNITVDDAVYSGDVKSLIHMAKLTAGEKAASVVFYGDSNYNEFTLTVNFNVSRLSERDVTVTVTVADVVYPNPAVALINVSGKANGTVIVTVNGVEYEAQPVTSGQASVDLGVLAAGIKNITARFIVGENDLINTNATGTNKFNVDKAASKVELDVDGRNVTVNVIGGEGKVAVYINGVKEEIDFAGSAVTLKDALDIGNNTVLAIYEGNANYTGSQNSTEAEILKNRALVNVTAETITYGSDASIVVRVGEGQSGHVTVTVNNEDYTAEIKDGGAVFNVPGLNAGNYTVSVKYSGDSNYDAESNETSLTVNKADLPASAEGYNVTVNDNTLFILNNVPDDFTGYVNITVDDIAFSGKPKSLIELDKLTVGDKTADVIFYGDSNYNDLQLTVNFTVSRAGETATAITITVPDVTYPDAATALINVTGHANGTVIVTVNGVEYEPQQVTDGQTTVELGVLAAGIHNITAKFTVGEEDFINTNATAASKFMVNKADSKVELTVDGRNVTVNVVGGEGKVAVYINGVKEEIDFAGSAVTLNDALDIGNNTVLAIYEGNANYTGSQNTTEAEILKNRALVNVTAETITYGSDAIIVVRVGEGQSGHVTVTVNNEDYTAEIKDGGAVFNVPGLNAGNYTVGVKYSGDSNYDAESNETSLTVNKADLPASAEGYNVTVNDNTLFILNNVPDDFTGYVNITVDDIAFSGKPKSLIELDKLTVGDKTADVIFYGDSNYNDLQLTVNFTVSRAGETATAVTITVPDVTYPDAATALINVTGHANGTVIVTVNGVEYEPQQVTDGQATVELGVLAAGIKNITAKFIVGETDMINTNATGANKFVVEKAQSNVKVSVQDGNIIVNVTDGSSANVTVYINGEKQVMFYNGEIITFENALSVGNNAVIAVYEGNENYTVSQNSTQYVVAKKESLVNAPQTETVYGSDATVSVNVPANQTGYVTILVDNQNYTQMIKDGKAVFAISGLAVGEYPVAITYLGDNTYDVQVNTTLIKVIKADLTAEVIGENITVIQNSEFIVTVPDDFTGKVNITVDGFTYSGDVKSLITMDKLTAGSKTAAVVFYGDSNYNDLSLTADFTVSELPVNANMSTVNAENMTRGYNSPFDYQAVFLDNEGNALVNATVKFIVNGKTYEAKTNDDGTARLTQSKLDIGVYDITSVNTETGEEITCKLTVVPRILENKDMTMDFRDGSSFVVKVIGDDGNIAPEGEIISIMANGIRYVAKVDAKGFAKLKINLNPKKYTVVSEYKTYTTTNKLVVKQTFKLVKTTVKVKKGKKLVLKAKLKWSNGKAIKGKKITFKFRGKKYTAKTNSKGIAKVTIKAKVTKKLKKGKTYSFRAKYLTNGLKGKVKVK